MRSTSFVGLLLMAATPQAAQACEYDEPLFQLPGETEADARTRGYEALSDYLNKQHLDHEVYVFENAKIIYLARVVAQGAEKGLPASATVRPVKGLKGPLPTSDRTLSDIPAGGLCTHRGDGDGAFGKVGEPVLVFEGLAVSEDLPRGIESFRTRFLRSYEVLEALASSGKALDD